MNSRLLAACFLFLAFFNAPVQAQEQATNCIQNIANSTNERITAEVFTAIQDVANLTSEEVDQIESSLAILTNGVQTVANNMIGKVAECYSVSLIQRFACLSSIPLSLSSGVTNLVSAFAGSLTIQDSKLVAQLIKIASQSVGQLPLNLLKCIQA